MTTTGSRGRRRVWKTAVVAVAVSVAAVGSLLYVQRFELALWIMQRNNRAQALVIRRIQERAAPLIETELTMTPFQKLFSAITGRRNEQERQTDALDDIREFNELSFENHRLFFRVAHNLDSLYGFELHGFDFVLGWKRGATDEVLAEFDVDWKTRKLAKMLIHQDSSYFTDLKQYIEERARVN